MGDSVGIQFSFEYQYAAGAKLDHRRVIRYNWGPHEGSHVAAPVRGGGVVAGWRITDFLKRAGMNKPPPNSPGGGWSTDDVDFLLNHTYGPDNNNSTEVEYIDVMTFRIPHGWIHLSEIDESKLKETVITANEVFGVSMVIFVGLHFINNVFTAEDLALLKQKNDLVRKFAAEWPRGQDGVESVLFLDFGRLSDSLVEWNARLIGYDTSNSSYLREHLSGCCPGQGRAKSIASVCSERVNTTESGCVLNSITVDGLHVCMKTVRGRFDAGVSCLIACGYNHDPPLNNTGTRSCERQCNDRFMSLQPVLVNDAALS
jgi:hypothetical protein